MRGLVPQFDPSLYQMVRTCPYCGHEPNVEVVARNLDGAVVIPDPSIVSCINPDCGVNPSGPFCDWQRRHDDITEKELSDLVEIGLF